MTVEEIFLLRGWFPEENVFSVLTYVGPRLVIKLEIKITTSMAYYAKQQAVTDFWRYEKLDIILKIMASDIDFQKIWQTCTDFQKLCQVDNI